ncbi:T9SS type A sorting domain-containing protein, partial [Kaistella sp.]|uniref:T9SS type A sorting domain-containing protein n=1 Tax=Kaistella sp. TaxID=2782235 RepID=UPI002F93C799
MKKFYSLVAAVVFAATVNAQGAETFESQTALTATYADGSFNGETSGVTVNYVHSRNEGLGTSDSYPINGKGLMLRRADEPSSVEFTINNGGVGTFTFSYRKAFTGGTNNRVLAVLVDGEEKTLIPAFGAAGADATVYTSTTTVNKTGVVKIKITYPAGTATGNKQITIDNVSWTAAPTAAVSDVNSTKTNLVKNTVVANSILFTAKADVQIVSMNGQVVKSTSVNENTSLDVTSLPKGMY